MAFTNDEIAQIIEEFFATVGARQYIGARYVPIFGRKGEDSIIWDGGEGTYEPLTVVLYQGNSFTSRQFVPVGVDISNDEFWAETGNYNAQIEQYRNDTVEARALAEAAQVGVDDINLLLPFESFNAENTVKEYIDSIGTSLQEDIEPLEATNKALLGPAVLTPSNSSQISFDVTTHYVQSMCFDDSGNMWVYAVPRSGVDANPFLYKYENDSMSFSAKYAISAGAHGNSITYNPTTGHILIISDGNFNMIEFDPTTGTYSTLWSSDTDYPISQIAISKDASRFAYIESRSRTAHEGPILDNVGFSAVCTEVTNIGYGVGQDCSYIGSVLGVLYFYGSTNKSNRSGVRLNKVSLIQCSGNAILGEWILDGIEAEGEGIDYKNNTLYVIDADGVLFTYDVALPNVILERNHGCAIESMNVQGVHINYTGATTEIPYNVNPILPVGYLHTCFPKNAVQFQVGADASFLAQENQSRTRLYFSGQTYGGASCNGLFTYISDGGFYLLTRFVAVGTDTVYTFQASTYTDITTYLTELKTFLDTMPSWISSSSSTGRRKFGVLGICRSAFASTKNYVVKLGAQSDVMQPFSLS